MMLESLEIARSVKTTSDHAQTSVPLFLPAIPILIPNSLNSLRKPPELVTSCWSPRLEADCYHKPERTLIGTSGFQNPTPKALRTHI